jgi:hypothetical protein
LMSCSNTHSLALSTTVFNYIVALRWTQDIIWHFATFVLFDEPSLNTPKRFCLFLFLP